MRSIYSWLLLMTVRRQCSGSNFIQLMSIIGLTDETMFVQKCFQRESSKKDRFPN